jgi:hypothetical protein
MRKQIIFLILAAGIASSATADEYLGNYSANKHNSNSTSNPHGAGSPHSADSINNPYGAGSPYRNDSPSNPYGEGLEIYGD